MAEITDNREWIGGALRVIESAWTPQCPDPETLLEWVERGDESPDSARLLDHVFSCAYCREQRIAMREIRALSAQAQRGRIARAVPAKLTKWVQDLINDGFTAPVAQVRLGLERLGPLTPVLARGQESITNLQPSGTAVRNIRPVLSWDGASRSESYDVAIFKSAGRGGLRSVWEGKTVNDQVLDMSQEAELEPGSYLWQVVATVQGKKVPSELVGFVVLNEAARKDIEALERKAEASTLARIALYEAYGLYDEAARDAEGMLELDGDDGVARRVRDRLRERRERL